MDKLVVTLKTVTPLFLGGANPDDAAELRAPSIKGMMRFWYRAIVPEYKANEPKIFGSTDEGQGDFLLRLENNLTDNKEWVPDRYNALNKTHPNFDEKKHDKRTWTINGVRYLSYSLKMKPNNRRFIPVDKEIKLNIILKPRADANCKKALLSSLWLLGHIGGIGSRSRRGFGTVALQDWKLNDKEITDLPIAHKKSTADKWLEKFEDGLKIIKEWYLGSRTDVHTIFGNNTKFYLFEKGKDSEERIDERTNKPVIFKPWEMALNEAGIVMQSFRQRYYPDYTSVKGHLGKKHPSAPCDVPRNYLKSAPQRTAFGLPLTFRFSSMTYKDKRGKEIIPQTEFQGSSYERNASSIHLRIIKIGSLCYPLYILLDAPLIEIKEKSDEKGLHPMKPPANLILDTFCNTVLKPVTLGGKEVVW